MADDPPAEITAEWTVHAQLTILRGGDHQQRSTNSDEPTTTTNTETKSKATPTAQSTTSYTSSSSNAHEENVTKTTFEGPSQSQPLRVVYKWSSDDLKAAGCNGRTATSSLNFGNEQKHTTSFTSNSTTDSGCCSHPKTVTSTTSPADIDDCCSPKCRSTCSILLSACTDLYPTQVDGGDSMAPPQYKTTATCVVTPSTGKIYRHGHTTQSSSSRADGVVVGGEQIANFLSVKDAFCQTSDVEFKAKSEPRTIIQQQSIPAVQQQQLQRTRSQRAYDYRRATESSLFQSNSLLSPNISFEEGTPLAPFSRQPSHSPVLIRQISSPSNRTYSPTPNVRVHQTAPNNSKTTTTSHKAMPKKQPRTVHIDVYCTGSEDDDSESVQSDGDDSSSSSSSYGHHRHHFNFNDDDAASNSTPQTVFNANQIKLHHSRVTNKRELPRRLAAAQQQQLQLQQPKPTNPDQPPPAYPTKPGQLRQYILDLADKDEINESKQMLFSKHVGGADPTASSSQQMEDPPQTKFSFSRHPGHYYPVVEPSEGGFSSNYYPNSSRSTFRDPTCSSISSAMASSSAVFDDLEPYGPNHNQECSNLSASDSFEYENAADRARILQMEQAWRTAAGNNDDSAVAQDGSPPNKGWRSPEKERKILLRQQRKLMDAMMYQNERQIREMTEEESSPCRLPLPPTVVETTTNAIYNNVTVVPPRPHHQRILFTPNYGTNEPDYELPRTFYEQRSPSVAHEQQQQQQSTNVSGSRSINNNNNNLSTRFGTRLETTRKKHFGPAKNPDCPCEHCRCWAIERGAAMQMLRGRTLSMGDENMTMNRRAAFWLTRH